jgi:hypothetical protein
LDKSWVSSTPATSSLCSLKGGIFCADAIVPDLFLEKEHYM